MGDLVHDTISYHLPLCLCVFHLKIDSTSKIPSRPIIHILKVRSVIVNDTKPLRSAQSLQEFAVIQERKIGSPMALALLSQKKDCPTQKYITTISEELKLLTVFDHHVNYVKRSPADGKQNHNRHHHDDCSLLLPERGEIMCKETSNQSGDLNEEGSQHRGRVRALNGKGPRFSAVHSCFCP